MDYWDYETIIEPFRIKVVEAIPLLTASARRNAIERAGWNLFKLDADAVTIDMLTDSGTGAMSSEQQAALMRGDESYAGSRSFRRLESVVKRLSGMPYIFPCHQGRAAERILARTLLGPDQIVVNNTHFDTTRANIEQVGAVAIDLPSPTAQNPSDDYPFKGDIDLDALRRILDAEPDRVAMVMLTLTNNAAGGQPVSMANLTAASSLCRARGIPFYLDAARFAENAWFVHTREPGYEVWSIEAIVKTAFDLSDGYTMSAKKDGMVNMGGLLCTRLPEHAKLFRRQLILGEGFPTYGGLAGRDLEALAVGLDEAMDPEYLRYRARTIAYFSAGLEAAGIPVVRPPGGHAVYIDAGAFLPHIPKHQFPAQALAAELYLEGGVRGVEVGSLMFPDSPLELLRLALPRRTYTQAHIDYVIEVATRVAARRSAIRGMEIVDEPPFLRHFDAALRPIVRRPAETTESVRAHVPPAP